MNFFGWPRVMFGPSACKAPCPAQHTSRCCSYANLQHSYSRELGFEGPSECMQAQNQEGYGTQYEVQNFSLPSTSRREEQHHQQPIQVRRV